MFSRFTSIDKFQKYQFISKCYMSTNAVKKVVKYTDTINLPKTKFPPRLSANKRIEVENELNKTCFASLYQWQRNHLCENEFVLHDGPPYANGELHMGHAINKILKDITLKYHISHRNKVHYKPGWDCHGLPIELKALSSNNKLSSIETRRKARKFASDTIEKQKTEFASWGITADWQNETNIYRTFDPKYIENQLNMFYDLYQKKLIFRDLKPVYWSPSSKTALAESELEYNSNFQSPSLTFRLKMTSLPKSLHKFGDSIYCLIWTTTPWTLPSNQAVCYNPDLSYSLVKLDGNDNLYIIATSLISDLPNVTDFGCAFPGNELQHCTYKHPINDDSLPFLPGQHVADNKGTGLVHTAPAHGPDDFLIALSNKIPIKCLVDENGLYTKEAPEFLQGKCVLTEGNDLVIDRLQSDVIISDKIIHSYPIDWRTKKPVIIRASDQWFINTDAIKDSAIKRSTIVELYPKISAEKSKQSLLTQLQKRPYWCISRQRVWGTPIPVFYHRKTNAPIVNQNIIKHLCDRLEKEKTIDFWWTASVEELIPKSVLNELGLDLKDIEKGSDILDIWFDSGISWSYALDVSKIADLYIEGVDQFNGWFQSSLMTSVGIRNKAPFKSIFVHGFAVDENGNKMSKSRGNVIDPKGIISKYGIDTLRWWVASHATQHASISVSYGMLQASAENIQKIRSILKYLVGCLPANDSQASDIQFEISERQMLDNYFLNVLVEFEKEITSLYKCYQYNRVTSTILNFITNDLSGLYLHIIKDRLYCGTNDEHKNLQQILKAAYLVLNKSLWPIVPFLVEESWSYYDTKPFYKTHVTVPNAWHKPDYKEIIDECISHKTLLNQRVQDTNTWTVDLSIICQMQSLQKLQTMHLNVMEPDHDTPLCEFLQVSSITLIPCENTTETSIQTSSKKDALCARCRRFAVNAPEALCDRCERVLSEKKFL